MSRDSTSSSSDWSVYQRADTLAWCVRYKEGEKWRDKRIPATVKVTTKRQAEAWARQWLAERAEVAEGGPETQSATLGSYLDAWVERRERNPKIRKTTLANNRAHITHYIAPKLGARTLTELKPIVLREYVAGLRDTRKRGSTDGLASYTIRNIAATLRAALDEAFDEGLLPANPMRSKAVQREMPKPTTLAGRNVIIHLPKADAERLVALPGLPLDRRARYLLALTSGLRDGEIAGLTWADIVTDHDVPHVDVSKAFDTNWESAAPKTENGYRKVPLHPLAEKALAEWKAQGFVLFVGRHATRTDPVFPNEHGKPCRPRSAKLLRDDLSRAGCVWEYAGIPLEFRALRRSFATWLAEAEVPDGIRKRLMGHGGGGVTDAHYTVKTLEALQAAVLRITLDLETAEVIPMPFAATATDGVAALLAAPPQQTATHRPRQPCDTPATFSHGSARHAGAALGLQNR